MSTKFGVHLLLDAYKCSKEKLASKDLLLKVLRDLPKQLNMHTIHDPVVVEVGSNNKKDPGGISGFVMIAESHISVHTFPNRGFLSADIYTCQDHLEEKKVVDVFKSNFVTDDVESTMLDRGNRYPKNNIY